MEAITKHEHVGRELPPAISERLGFLFGATHQAILRMARDTGVLDEPLTGKHFGCLTVISSEGPLSQQALGQRMGVDRSTIVALVDDLEAAGLVERRRNPADRRAYALQATAAGRRWQARAEKAIIEVENELLAPLSAEERRQLIALIQRLLVR